jgi:putative selenate reductase
MSAHLKPLPFNRLLSWILDEYLHNKTVFGIPERWFYRPETPQNHHTTLFGRSLATAFGPAAGPHTQMAQNIISAWLCGARFIELKTVQIMDNLEIPRPCIDMSDEGYNVEWSQELALDQSICEYVNAWAIIHILKRVLNISDTAFGTIFNMSVGYTLDGIQSPPMQRFIGSMKDASAQIDAVRHVLNREFPEFSDVHIPSAISDNVTVSTMHGCPPEEIERIGDYLIRDHGLHTLIKLNPTLAGKETVNHILKDRLGYDYISIPDAVFDNDLQWNQALNLISALTDTAQHHQRFFGIKLSNTLAMANVLKQLPGDELYMSGRALFPVTVHVFDILQKAFDHTLHVSYSGGADAVNIAALLAAGAMPVTVASDILKPGGYGRFTQYIRTIDAAMKAVGAQSLEQLRQNAPQQREMLAITALEAARYHKQYRSHGLPKLVSVLTEFNCITAPCTETCPAHQNPPEYIRGILSENLDAAFQSIIRENPLPGLTGFACPHECQTRCTRNAYDEPVAIRRLKRYVSESVTHDAAIFPSTINNRSHVAIIGAGPAGLAAAAFLAKNGIASTLFETRSKAGGVPCIAPSFRIPEPVIQKDVNRIVSPGVRLMLNTTVETAFDTLMKEYDAVFYAPGFQKDRVPDIPGFEGPNAFGILEFLTRVKQGMTLKDIEHVVIIGGGNTAIDGARTAARLTGRPATILYRRNTADMPAWEEEIQAFFDEKNRIVDHVIPIRVNRVDGQPVSVTCLRTVPGEPDADGRRKPVPQKGSEFDVPAELVIAAIGQQPDYDISVLKPIVESNSFKLKANPDTAETAIPGVFAGGDAVRGPASIIEAVADAAAGARAIARNPGYESVPDTNHGVLTSADMERIHHARTHLSSSVEPGMRPLNKRHAFDVVEMTYSAKQAVMESERCLQCDLICDRCVDVCPNRANIAVVVDSELCRIPVLRIDSSGYSVIRHESVDSHKKFQQRQIIHIVDWCNECGNCTVFCTHTGEPFKTKPCFYLSEAIFNEKPAETNAWLLKQEGLMRWCNGKQLQMIRKGDTYLCVSDDARIEIKPDFTIISTETKRTEPGEMSLKPFAEMMVLYHALQNYPMLETD